MNIIIFSFIRDASEVIFHTNDSIAPVGYLKLNKLVLQTKLPPLDLTGRLDSLPLKDSDGYVTDYGVEAFDFNEDDDLDSVVQNDTFDMTTSLKQTPVATKSSDGWLWIGGIQGDSPDSETAMQQAMDTLQCRYA